MYSVQQKLKDREKKLRRRVKRVISHPYTMFRKTRDFPNIHEYIKSKFSLELDIEICLCHPDAMKSNGFIGMYGCYIEMIPIILVYNNIKEEKVLFNDGKFSNLLYNLTNCKIDTEDVVVHEVIHAVSAKINRYNRYFKDNEEEFVFTNCIDFYKNIKKMTDEEIINNNFLPYMTHVVMNDYELMGQILKGLTNKQISLLSPHQYTKILNKNAEHLVPEIISFAKQKAMLMISLYNKYGCERSCPGVGIENRSLRFTGLDFSE